MQVEQFVFSSTMLVHAPCEPGQTINEDWPLAPRWPYPESKVETEKLIEKDRRNIRTTILRIAGVYDDVCHAIPLAHQIQRIYERQVTSTVFPGHISHGQSFVHLDDLVDAFVRTIERRRELPETLTVLIGEPDVVSYDELQHQFGRLIHDEADWQTRQIPKALAKTGAWVQDMMPLVEDPFIKPWMIDFADDHYALDLSRANKLLDWYPMRSLRGTLPKMIAALKRDPDKWYREHHLRTQAKAA
jgi:nucleoside-diphosphate-sugar epimerase